MAQLHVMLEVEDAPSGSLILIRLSRLAEMKRQSGHHKLDAILKRIGALLISQAQ